MNSVGYTDGAVRSQIAAALDNLVAQTEWNEEAWLQCWNLFQTYGNDELVAHGFDDLVHYSGVFHERNLLGFRVAPQRTILEGHQRTLRNLAAALRANMSLEEARKSFDL